MNRALTARGGSSVLWRKGLRAFTLIELSIVLIVVGIITAGVLKGHDLLQSARVQSTINQVETLRVALETYREQGGLFPADDRLNDEMMGCLLESGVVAESPKPRIGEDNFRFEVLKGRRCIVLDNLTPKQAESFKRQSGVNIQPVEGKPCFSGGNRLNLSEKAPVCRAFIEF